MKFAVFCPLLALLCTQIAPAAGLRNADEIENYSLHFKSHVAVYIPFGISSPSYRLAIGGLVHPRFVICGADWFTFYTEKPGVRVMIGSPWAYHGGQLFDVDHYTRVSPFPAVSPAGEDLIAVMRIVGEFRGPDRSSHLAFMPSYEFAPQAKAHTAHIQIFQTAGFGREDVWGKTVSYKLNSLMYKRHSGAMSDCTEFYTGLRWYVAQRGDPDDFFFDCYFHVGCKGNKICVDRGYRSYLPDDGAPVMLRNKNIMVGTIADYRASPFDNGKEPVGMPMLAYSLKNFQYNIVREIRSMQTDMYAAFPDDLMNHEHS